MRRRRLVRSREQRSDAGDTLVEVLIAIVIIGISVASGLAGVATVVRSSATHRAQATEETVLRSFAEDLIVPPGGNLDPTHANLGYQPCASSYTVPSWFAVPSGFSAPVTSVETWDGSSNPPQWETGSCTDHGLQQVTITESTTSGSPSESITVLKAEL